MSLLPTSKIHNPLLPFPVNIRLASYTLLCYRLPIARVRRFLPMDFEPVRFEVDGEAMTWFSIFFGRNVLHGLGALPALPLHFEMCNYRLYVQDPQERRSLFIFRSLLSLPPAALGMQLLRQFPGEYAPYKFSYDASGTELFHHQVEIGHDASELAVTAEAIDGPPAAAGFESSAAAVDYLGDVPVAYFPRWDASYGKMVSNHPPLQPKGGRVVRADLNWLVDKHLLTRDEAANPASVLMQADWPFPTYV